MIFPESPRETYDRNPLKEVVCQLRFPTILRVITEPPARFQEGVRAEYPIYTKEGSTAGLPKEVSEFLAGLPISPGPRQSVTHKFETAVRQRFISLNEDFLAVADRGYTLWRHFRTEMERAERVLQETYQPPFYERIGLRYQNIIDRDSLNLGSLPWTRLLNPSLLGLLGATERDVRQIRTQSLVTLPGSEQAFMRVVHGLATVKDTMKQVYTIDADFYSEQRSETGHAFRVLDEFNGLAAKFFRWAITPELRTALGPRPIN